MAASGLTEAETMAYMREMYAQVREARMVYPDKVTFLAEDFKDDYYSSRTMQERDRFTADWLWDILEMEDKDGEAYHEP